MFMTISKFLQKYPFDSLSKRSFESQLRSESVSRQMQSITWAYEETHLIDACLDLHVSSAISCSLILIVE
ncbi:MAG: hypothetical protein B6D63_06540 [Candidatus Latescibacteria bacterium 4484_7]|nr:MAG: hypothetical protein B6D63_06540 [Candidatus Latescibacteria bacterium 4484_7]